MRLGKADEPGRVASGALAVLVHLMFFGLLVFGISWQKKIASPVVVDLWQDLPEPSKKAALPPEPPKPVPKVVAPPPKPVAIPEVKQPPPPPPVPKVETPKVSAADIELKEKLRKQKEEEAQQREELKRAEAARKEELKREEAERQEEQKRAEAERKEEQKKAELEKRKLEEEQRKAAEEQRREEAEQKRAEQEKLRKEDEARRAEEHKRAEEQKRVEEARREEERKQRAADTERERQQQEAARKQREAVEAKQRAEAAARAAQDKLVADYVARIKAQVQRRVVLPPNMEGNPQAEFYVVLIPGGEVLSATIRKSSGNSAYDAAVERAILAAQPLPVPTDPELFQDRFRELVLKFRPRE